MSGWIYEPRIRVGLLNFNSSIDEISAKFHLRFAGDLNELYKETFDDSERFCEDGVGESWGLEDYLDDFGFFKVKLEFNENGLLETICDAESFVFLGSEIIGLPESDLSVCFGKPEEIVKIPHFNAFSLYVFNDDIMVSILNGRVDRITVSSYSIPSDFSF
ncbi:hypothetical protein [Stenoxybacter acetivorans]|uniref:hypothetical protein n=1 Tax=Stenoxybacter acetivorans TaxID=422441 RepID=UPI00056C1843|nr:hypothetical protein [Stenoxybacter acetivorans]